MLVCIKYSCSLKQLFYFFCTVGIITIDAEASTHTITEGDTSSVCVALSSSATELDYGIMITLTHLDGKATSMKN